MMDCGLTLDSVWFPLLTCPPFCHSPYVVHYSMHIMRTYATPTQGKHTGEDKSTHERCDATPLSVLCLLDGGSAAACSAYIW